MLLLSVCLWVEIVEVHLVNFVGEDRLIPSNLRSNNINLVKIRKVTPTYAGGSMDASFSATLGSKEGGKTTLN